MRARAHDIVAIDACPLFAPGLAGAIAAANALAAAVRGIGKPLDIQATATLGGLDFDLRGSGPPDDLTRRKLAAAAETARSGARSSVHGETIDRAPAAGDRVRRRAGDVPPPGGFLQATAAGEQALADGAAAALQGAKRVADLFCGAGAFALRLAREHEVFAVDSDAAAIAALTRAAGAASGLRAVHAETPRPLPPAARPAPSSRASTPCCSIRRAPGPRRRRARSPRRVRRSSSRSPATPTASPATRAS